MLVGSEQNDNPRSARPGLGQTSDQYFGSLFDQPSDHWSAVLPSKIAFKMVPMAGLEPARAFYGPTDFKSVASAISPHRRREFAGV